MSSVILILVSYPVEILRILDCLFASLTVRWLIASWNTFILDPFSSFKRILQSSRNGMKCGMESFRSQHVTFIRLCTSSSTNRNWERVRIFLLRKRNQRIPMVALYVLFLLQRFNLKLFLNTTTFDTNCTPIPVNSTSTIFSFLFCSSYEIHRARFNCRNSGF